jgi:hypothetical protein
MKAAPLESMTFEVRIVTGSNTRGKPPIATEIEEFRVPQQAAGAVSMQTINEDE